MSIEEYIYLASKTPFPFLVLIFVIVCEFLLLTRKGERISLKHTISNFGILLLGTTFFSFFSYYIVTRDDVLLFTERYSLFHLPVTWVTFFILLIVFDFINYATHVLYHKSSFFWMFHATHHSDYSLDASTTVRVSFAASFFTVSSYAFLSLFGVPVMFLPALAQTMFLQQIIVHSSVLRGQFPSFVSRVLITPDLHALHHTEKYNNKNFGFLFSVWDRVFGTDHLENCTNEKFGIESYIKSHNPFRAHVEPIMRYFQGK